MCVWVLMKSVSICMNLCGCCGVRAWVWACKCAQINVRCVGIYISSVYLRVYLYMYVRGCTRLYLYARVGVKHVFMFICIFWLCATTFRIRSVRSGPVAGDPNPIRIRALCGADTMAIRRPIHEKIRGSVPVRAVKTRR